MSSGRTLIHPYSRQDKSKPVQASPRIPTDTAAQVDLSDGVLYCFGVCTMSEQNQMIKALITRDHHEQSQDKPN